MSSILEAAKTLLDQTREIHELRDRLKAAHRTLRNYRMTLVQSGVPATVMDELLGLTDLNAE